MRTFVRRGRGRVAQDIYAGSSIRDRILLLMGAYITRHVLMSSPLPPSPVHLVDTCRLSRRDVLGSWPRVTAPSITTPAKPSVQRTKTVERDPVTVCSVGPSTSLKPFPNSVSYLYFYCLLFIYVLNLGGSTGEVVTWVLRLPPSLVGSQMSRETMSEQSSVRDGAGYDEVFQTGHEPGEGSSWSSGDGSSVQSSDGKAKDYGVGGGQADVVQVDDSESDGGSDDGTSESTSGGSRDDRPFILPKEWSVNYFLPTMTEKIFNSLRARNQIPDDIPIRLPLKKEKCYSGRTADVGMYDAMFAAGLRLPLTALHRRLANYLGLSVSQIAPNAWRVFIGSEILWGSLSGGNRQLTLEEFFWCYRPHHVSWCLTCPTPTEIGKGASIRPEITGEQEAFILKVTGIPLEERKCRDLITPDALHAYCGGPAPSEEAPDTLFAEMEARKLKAQIRAAAARKKEEEKGKEGASKSLPKAANKGVPKRKGDSVEDRPAKKPTVTLGNASLKPPSPKHGAGKGLMTAQGPVAQEDRRCLLTHKEFALERLDSILGKVDADICADQPVQELGDSGLFDLARFDFCRFMVRMRAIQVKGAKNEELMALQRKRITNLSDGLDQYKDACRTLNGEIKELKEKLEEIACQLEQEREAKMTAEKELTSLLGQVETAKADAVTEFRTSQTFIDACAEYYGEGFEDCLKQVKSLYPHLDLSRVSMDDPVPSTPVGDTVVADDDTLSGSGTHQKVDGIVLAQPALDSSGVQKLPSSDPSSFECFPAV
ncbi:hypothetical protein SO802_025915 [Lithocarpus litseifolius]|uniref:Uncharacterized protein n=1 Tax=Lithocarpus litseifolius TaxID=425828 RepID=A0AAW2C3I2_9ROSI